MPLNPIIRTCVVLVALCAGVSTSAQEAGSTVEKCPKSFGTLAVAEPQSSLGQLSRYGLGSPATLLRMMVQQSGCFDVVERGVAMQNLQQERALASSGDLRQDSNLGQGQLQAADFVMTPVVQIAASDVGGFGGALLGRLGPLGALAGGLKFKEAETSLLVADVRSGIQVAAAEGKASKTEFSIGGWAGGAAALGGYARTPEGKVVAASLLDNYNKSVATIRDKPQLIRPSSAAGDANAAASTRAEAPQRAGQMLAAKIANVKVHQEPSRDSPVVATLQRSDELVASGEARMGFVHVDAANFSWVPRTLVGPIAGSPAPAAAAPAPAPVPLVQAPAVSYRYGNFAGTADGADKGSFGVLVDDRGRITGEGGFNRMGVFGLMGQYDVKEDALMMHGSSGAGGLLFIGRYDAARGVISESWTIGGAPGLLTGAGGGGTFSAQRQ